MDLLRQSSATRESLSLLSVMEALSEGKQITQRELSRATGLNLKKINYSLHKLLEKGYVKFQRARHNPDKRTYLYILTPAGLKAKSQLTYNFLKFTLSFYGQMEAKLHRCLGEMAEAGVKRVVLYGAGDVARILLGLTDAQVKIIGVVDEWYEGEYFYGVRVLRNGQLLNGTWDGVLITGLEEIEEVENRLLQAGVAEKAIWTLS
jgi:DNA-binding MarR family transcriptional regulator